MPKHTHFGFKSVALAEKQKLIDQIFDSVATRYDLMNDLMSGGLHRLWKHLAITELQLRPQHQVLDLACGTGDLTQRMAPKVRQGHIYLGDINRTMLALARNRLIDLGQLTNLSYTQLNAESLPFAEHSFDRIIIGFGLRNVPQISHALSEFKRCLKPGGMVLILEFSQPPPAIINKLYSLYCFKLLPWLGKHVAQDESSYQYLAESIRVHPDQETLKSMLLSAGFKQCTYHNLNLGIVAIHKAYKL
jgi:demethylmenaquinone methyltransferase/2-methoxy-6-polyprenyl-1,4-benzoquinol methylase